MTWLFTRALRAQTQWTSKHMRPPGVQGMEALRGLERNMAAEALILADLSHMFAAVITPHQRVCGDLAAWPQSVYMSRLVRYMGKRLHDREGCQSEPVRLNCCIIWREACDVQCFTLQVLKRARSLDHSRDELRFVQSACGNAKHSVMCQNLFRKRRYL